MALPQILISGAAVVGGVLVGGSAAEATGTVMPSLRSLVMGGPALAGTGAGGQLNNDLIDLLGMGQRTIPDSRRQLLSQDMTSHFNELNEIIRTRVLNADPADKTPEVMRGRRAAVASIEATRMALQDSMSNAAVEAGVRSDPTRVAPFQQLRSEIRGLKGRAYTSDEVLGIFDRFRQLTDTVQGIGTIYGSNYQQNLEFANEVISGGLRRADDELLTAQAGNASGRGLLIPLTPHFRLSYDSPMQGSRSSFISPRPVNSRDIARGALSSIEQENYDAFQRLFRSSGVQQYIHNTSPDTARGSDLYEILTQFRVVDPRDPSRVTEETRRLRYARYSVGGRSIAFPLSVNYRSTANIGENQHLTALGTHGAEIYHADRAGSQIYAGPGRIITIDNARAGQPTTLSQGTLNYLFNPYRFSEVQGLDTGGMPNKVVGQVEDIVRRMNNGEDLGSILFTYGDDEDLVSSKTKILESIDHSGNVDLALEKKAAQVMVTATDLENYGKADSQETFELARQAARQEIGTDVYPIAGPGATSKGIFMDPSAPFTVARVGSSEVNPRNLSPDDPAVQLADMQEARMNSGGAVLRSRGRGLAPYHPSFTPGRGNPRQSSVTKLKSYTPMSRLPGRKLISPFRVINPGSNRAMRILGPMQNWLPFRNGPYRTMMATGIAPAVNGTWFSTPLGSKANKDILQEGAVRQLHPYEQEPATFAFPGSRARIELGTVDDPLEVNPKLMGVIRQFEGQSQVMQSGDQAITPQQRRRLVANALQDENVTFEPGEILGKEVDNHGQVRLSRAGGRSDVEGARMFLADIIPDERGYNLVFEEEVNIEAAKSEGTVKSTSMRNWSTNKIDAPVMDSIRDEIEQIRERYAQMEGTRPADELRREMRAEIEAQRERGRNWMEGDLRKTMIMAEHDKFMARVIDPSTSELSATERAILNKTENVITHFSEGKEIFKEGNRRAMLGQQHGALSLLTGQSLEDIIPHGVSESITNNPSNFVLPEFDEFYNAAAGPTRYTQRDAATLQELLRRAGALVGGTTSGEERVSLFGKIFGMEQDTDVGILRALKEGKGTEALLKIGYDQSMIDDLIKGIEGSKFVAGVLERFPRDAAAEARKDANVEKRAIEAASNELAAGAENNVRYAGAVDAVSNIAAQTNKPEPHAVGAWQRISMSTEAGKAGNIPSTDVVLNLNERSTAGTQARLADLNRIRNEGGYLQIHGTNYFVPGESDARALAMSVSRSGRTTVSTDLYEIIQKVLNNASANVSAANDDALDVLVSTLRKELYPLVEQIGREQFVESPLMGEIHGAKYLLSMGTVPEQLALKGEEIGDLSAEVYKRGRSRVIKIGSPASASLAAGERMGFSKSFINDHFKLLEDYVLGMEQPANMDSAEFARSRDAAVDALKSWKKGVLRRERLFPILEAQPPEISSESNKLVFGVYDPDRDELGGVSSIQVGEWHDKQTLETVNVQNDQELGAVAERGPSSTGAGLEYIRTDSPTENKSSADLDGDLKRFIAVITAQDPNQQNTPGARIGIFPGADPLQAVTELESLHGQLETSGAAAIRRSSRRRNRIRGTILEDAINSALKSLAASSTNQIPVDNVSRAFVAQSGQAEIGLVSSAINQVRQILQIAHRKGSMTHAEAQLLDVFTTQLEQKSVGFKHLTQSIGQPLSERIKMIMSQQNPRHRAAMIRQFIEQLTNARMNLPADMDERLAQTTAETTPRMVAAATTAATPGDIASEMGSGEMGTVREALLSAAGPETREAYEASVVNAQPSPQAEANARSVINNLNLPEDLSAPTPPSMGTAPGSSSAPSGSSAASSARAQSNAATVAAGNRAGTRRQAATAAERSANATAAREATRARASNIMQAEARGVAQNSIARIVGIGAAVAVGAYALFNKGYDDTPISDIPPPPSGMSMMGGNGQMPTQGMTGMGSTYNRQARDFSEGSQGGGYVEGNIPAPTSIGSNSYLDGSTARINSRNVTIDRTTASEYARSIRSGLPSSNVGLTINNNYYVPSDIERKL
jgi:hypothetical protein